MAPSAFLAESGNPPTPAWPGFKLQWLRENDPDAYRDAECVLMPKDFINLRLTGERAMDTGDASCSFLMNPRTRRWSQTMIDLLGVDAEKLPSIREPLDILGRVTEAAAEDTGLQPGTPVLVGGADFPVALLGSGACRPGLASDVTGTSCILTLIADAPSCSTRRFATSPRSRETGGPSSSWRPAATRCVGRAAHCTRRR